MSDFSIDSLNQKYAIDEDLVFKEDPNGFIYTDIANDSAKAQVYLHGAHITSYIPKCEEPVIFLSPKSLFEPGKAIRGGIPISWPWFADHPTDKTKPAHGFARTSEWEVRGTRQLSGRETQITLGINDEETTYEIWRHRFDLEIAITVGKELNVELAMTNTDKEEYVITCAFHTYYHVGDVNEVSILGLENKEYIDKVDNFTTKTQEGSVRITKETDRIYLNTSNDCLLEDRSLDRKIRISKKGSNSTVVWNPWGEKAKGMKDLGNDDYNKFVCVESTNAGDDIITIAPGGKHVLGLNISTGNNKA